MSDIDDSIDQCARFSARRSRILNIQKKTLVQLIQNHCIKIFGHHTNANFDMIDMATWKRFSEILNTWGPAKSPRQWKTARIRKKVELIRQSDAKLEDNLSELDLKIHNMTPAVDYDLLNDELNNLEDPPYTNEDDIVDYEFLNTNLQEEQQNLEVASTEVDSRSIMIAETAEGLEEDLNEPIIIEDFYPEDPSDETIYNQDTSNRVNIGGITKESRNGPGNGRESRRGKITRAKSIPKSSSNLPKQVEKTVQSSTVQSVETSKTNVKIPDIQKERLVELVENDYLKAFGRFGGVNGVYLKDKFWKNVAKELNTLGPARTVQQWKTTFSTIKSSTKAKLADNHNNEIGQMDKPLTRMEEKIVSMIGLDIMDGNQRIGEAGFNYRKTVPISRQIYNSRLNKNTDPQVSSTVTSGAFARLSENIDYQQTLNEESPSSLPLINRSEEARNTNMNVRSGNDWNISGQNIDEDGERRASREDSVLQEILQEIRADGPSTNSATNANRNNSRLVMSGTAAERNNSITSPPRRIFGPSTRGNNSTLSRLSDDDQSIIRNDKVHSRCGNPNVSSTQGLEAAEIRRIIEWEERDERDRRAIERGQTVVRRDRSNLRNRYTSFDMVQRSITQQERFIEQEGRNHAEMIYTTDRNHAQLIGVVNSTLLTLADIAREYINKN